MKKAVYKRIRAGACLALLALTAVNANAQYYYVNIDTKTARQVATNTAAAYAQETLHEIQQDTVMQRTNSLLAATLIHYNKYEMDMSQRLSDNGFRREGALYAKLVRECNRFVNLTGKFLNAAVHSPQNLTYCYRSAISLGNQARQAVKEAVVIGMNSKVPNPFKVNYNDLYNGIDTVPAYREDPEVKYDEDEMKIIKERNLLLPDERIRIVNDAIMRLSTFNRTLTVMTWKLDTHFSFRELLRQYNRGDYIRLLNTEAAYAQVKNDLNKLQRLW